MAPVYSINAANTNREFMGSVVAGPRSRGVTQTVARLNKAEKWRRMALFQGPKNAIFPAWKRHF
jgi:hypothetical protein